MKIIKGFGVFCMVIAGAIFLMIAIYSEVMPEGTIGKQADILADKMLASINHSSWEKTGAVSWGYRGHWFIWDRDRHFSQVKFDGIEILIDINGRKGVILEGGDSLSEKEKSNLCEKAWKLWVNDSFWLNPVSKCKDDGTTRKIVNLNDGRQGLMVSYSSGGATPGDSYVWILDEHYRPTAWKLWVSIIPIKGMEFTWEDWVQLKTGVWIATTHEGVRPLPILKPQGYFSLLEMTNGVDIFTPLKQAKIKF